MTSFLIIDDHPLFREALGNAVRLALPEAQIFEAMSMGLPVVSTTVGAEGLSVNDGEQILLRDDPTEFAAAVVELLINKNLAEAIGRQAAESVRTSYGWANVAAEFAAQCDVAISNVRKKDHSFLKVRNTRVEAV